MWFICQTQPRLHLTQPSDVVYLPNPTAAACDPYHVMLLFAQVNHMTIHVLLLLSSLLLLCLQLGQGIDENSHFAISLAVVLLHVRQGDGLEIPAAATTVPPTHVVQFVLAQVVDNPGPDGVAQDVDGRSEPGIFKRVTRQCLGWILKGQKITKLTMILNCKFILVKKMPMKVTARKYIVFLLNLFWMNFVTKQLHVYNQHKSSKFCYLFFAIHKKFFLLPL